MGIDAQVAVLITVLTVAWLAAILVLAGVF